MSTTEEVTDTKPKPKRSKVVPPEVFCARASKKTGRKVEPAPEQVFKVRMAGVGDAPLALTAEGVTALQKRYEAAMRELVAAVRELHDARGTPALFARRKVALARAEETFKRDLSDARTEIEGN